MQFSECCYSCLSKPTLLEYKGKLARQESCYSCLSKPTLLE